MRKVVFLDTVLSVVPLYSELCRNLLPSDVEVWHVADEILARMAVAQGELSPFFYRRVAGHVVAAEEAGAVAVQFTCSSISPCAEVVRSMVKIPILKADEAMVDQALTLGTRVGVAGTAPTALKPTSELVARRAAVLGKPVTVETMLTTEAYPYLIAGDMETHDRIICEGLQRLMGCSDVILLAQASMARVVERIPEAERTVPILASPRLAVERLRDVLAGLGPQPVT